MIKLSKTEEKIMGHLWQMKQAYLKEIIECFPEPKPATTTMATLLKRMVDKKVIDFEQRGKSRLYFPLIQKKAYFKNTLGEMVSNFFNDSPVQFASFFTKENDLSKDELEDLQALIKEQIKKLE